MEEEWTYRPPLLVGERVLWNGGTSILGGSLKVKQGIYHGKVAWVGRIKELGDNWIAGVEMEKSIKGTGDGTWKGKHLFSCKAGHGIFTFAENLSRISDQKRTSKTSEGLPQSGICGKKANPVSDESSKSSLSSEKILRKADNKGGTKSNKELIKSNSKSKNLHNDPANENQCFSGKKSGRSNSVKSVFNSITKKEKDLSSSTTLKTPSNLEKQSKSTKEKGTALSVPEKATDSLESQSRSTKTGLRSIFKWFTKKENLNQGTVEKKCSHGVGSTTSLVSDTSSIKFYPIRHSVSADNSNTMVKSYNMRTSSLKRSHIEQGKLRRSSVTSTQSNVSLCSSHFRPKKRMAPKPPESSALGSSSAVEIRSDASIDTKEKIRHFERSQSESPVYGKIKRKAPQPPVEKLSHVDRGSIAPSQISISSPNRPLSTFSNFSSISQSGSSTLQSSTCSENESLTMKSDSSQKTTSSFPLCHDNQGPLSPKPWYKRKKMKEKSHKSSKKDKHPTYDIWMPDIQYARQTISTPEQQCQSRSAEAFFDRGPKHGERFSILSSISDLDRAATEQFEREKAKKKEAKLQHDRLFYNAVSPHILSQKDLVPNKEQSKELDETLFNDKRLKSNATTTYDNVHFGHNQSTPSFSPLEQSRALPPDKSRSEIPETSEFNSSDFILNNCTASLSENCNSCDAAGSDSYDEYIEKIKKELEEENGDASQNTATKSTPMERASFDPELFYQLAKDAKITTESKLPILSKPPKESEGLKRKTPVRESSQLVSSDQSPPCHRLRPPHKNFGLRMNNFFTPDVSTILEGSESVTSSNATTTPAEDFNDDFQDYSALSNDQANEFMSISSEYRLNTSDLQEIIENFALDLKNNDKKSEKQKGGAAGVRKNTKADQIRDEVLLLRERENFLKWQKVMQETELTRDDDEAAVEERKKKWVCNMCTLINQPWRLHCEACGSLRPPNPRRVDNEDILLNSPDHTSSYRTNSNDSPVTVIHDERHASDHFNETFSSENVASQQLTAFGGSEAEITPTLNWETELQSYFTVFDSHAAAGKILESQPGSQLGYEKSSNEGENLNIYGKINVTRRNVAECPDNNLGNRSENRFTNLSVNNNENMDVNEVRRARIRRFQLNYSGSQEPNALNIAPNNEMKRGCGNGIREKISQLSELAVNDPRNIVNSSSSCTHKLSESNLFKNEEKESCKNEHKKSPILMPRGAVKNVVSIFNQMDQLKAVQENPPPVKIKKRKSLTNIINFSDFQRLLSGTSETENTTSARPNSPVMVDIDIASAISKFDEMAAMAEIDSIRKPSSSKQNRKWMKPQGNNNEESARHISSVGSNQSTQDHQVSSEMNCSNSSSVVDGTTPLHGSFRRNENPTISSDEDIDNRGSRDSIIRDGILYTAGEARRRSMSIGSGTFELLNAKEFASIEAHHSRRPSPAEEYDGLSVMELSHPLLMPEIYLEPTSPNKSPTQNGFVNSTRVENDSSGSDVETLSRQLTKADGLATFRASLAKDGSEIGETNTKTINRLLKKLESAISNGRHEEASQLARDLAKMKLNCLVTNKPLINSDHNDASHVTAVRSSIEGSALVLNHGHAQGTDTTNVIGDTSDPSASSTNRDYSLRCHARPSGETNDVMKRNNRVDPSRREVKSDTTHHLVNKPSHFENKPFNVKMYVEDRASHQGPILLTLLPSMTVGDLKAKISEEFGFPAEVQRWILGRLLADDDSQSLAAYKVNADGCPVFLYLVAPDPDTVSSSSKSTGKCNSEVKADSILRVKTDDVESTSKRLQANKDSKMGNADISKGKQGSSKKVLRKRAENFKEEFGSEPSIEAKGSPESEKAVSVGKNKSINKPSATVVDPDEGWVCPQCTLINHKERPGCEACATERPESRGKKRNLRQAMFALEAQGCVANREPFDCLICFMSFEAGEGVVLRDCLHVFCRECLTNAVKYSETARVKCPFSDKNYSCQFSLQDREVRDLISEEDYRKHLDKSVKEAAGSMRNIFYCKTPDCKGFCQYEDNVNVFICDVCRKANCLTCQAQHGGQTCKQYQDELSSKQDEDALKTKKFFDDIIRRGDGMPCPQCSVMLVRKWGCDWMRCPMCRTEICWVTRMPRWGPEGQGDTSGGCKCGVNGRKCHPKCTYCH